MATRAVTEGVNQWRNDMPFPKDLYQLHCVEESLETSQAGNPMLVRKWEIVSPETARMGDLTISVGGVQFTQYLTCKVRDGEGWDVEKSDKAFGGLKTDLIKLGFTGNELDDENPPLLAKGKTVDAVVYGKADKKYKSPTPEQMAQGRKVGDAIKDSSGKEIVVYQLQLDGGIQGLANKQISSAF